MANHLISFLLQSVDALHLSTPAVANHFISTVICFNFLEQVTLVSPHSSRQIHVPLFTPNSQQLPLSTPYCSKKNTPFSANTPFYTILLSEILLSQQMPFYTIPLSRNIPLSTNAPFYNISLFPNILFYTASLSAYRNLNKYPFRSHNPLNKCLFLNKHSSQHHFPLKKYPFPPDTSLSL